jgi:hypothetical protein
MVGLVHGMDECTGTALKTKKEFENDDDLLQEPEYENQNRRTLCRPF